LHHFPETLDLYVERSQQMLLLKFSVLCYIMLVVITLISANM